MGIIYPGARLDFALDPALLFAVDASSLQIDASAGDLHFLAEPQTSFSFEPFNFSLVEEDTFRLLDENGNSLTDESGDSLTW